MVLQMELFQILILSDGIFKPAMTYQFLLEMNQQPVASDGQHLINMHGQTDAKKNIILTHNITGLLTTSVVETQVQTLKDHQISFSQTETSTHGVVVVS